MGSDEPTKTVPRIHGLIIGINTYKRPEVHLDLLGCEGDARSVLNYFTQDLGVPEDHFFCLFNENATREAILNAFVNHLINNPKIKRYEPIVIYYAGHGSRMPAPKGWQSSDGHVEMLLPHDASTFDAHGQYVYGIPDLTMAFLLYKLSQAKGNNITVILDSCHSGSGTRRSEVRIRHTSDPEAPPIPNELDARLRQSLSVDYPSEVEQNVTSKQPSGTLMAPSLDTHTLLAACREDELAQEIVKSDPISGEIDSASFSGVFTTTLLQELRKCDLATTSYTTLLRNLLQAHREYRPKITQPLAQQTFQCEGRNQDRMIFSAQYSISKGKIALMPTSDRSVFRVRVGSAQGVVPGTEFGVFSGKMSPTSPPVALLVARDVGPTISQLYGLEPNRSPNVPDDAYVSILKYNDHSNGVRIWVEELVKRNELWGEIRAHLSSLPIYWANSSGDHDIALQPYSKDIELRGAHLTPGRLEISHILKSSLGAEKIAGILAAAVYFHFHLKIQNPEGPLCADLGMTLRELNEKADNWGSPIYELKGDDLFGESVSTGKVATLHPDPSKIFGIELTNRSTTDLYPYVFYYDFEDYSVGCLYEPPGRTSKSPLEAGKSLTIGYGSGGSQPFQVDFTRRNSMREYGAFVLLVFSEWVDISYFQQESPFDAPPDHRGRLPPPKPKVWDSVVVRVQLVRENKQPWDLERMDIDF